LGLDRSLIAAYGQDDRICAYATLKAMENMGQPAQLALGLFADKEEIGSVGNTGMQSNMLEILLEKLIRWSGEDAGLYEILGASQAISADVNAGLDPTYPEVMDKHNAARLGYGLVITKYTGSGGKYNANDADAEYVSRIRKLYNDNQVLWQTGELGKVDQGGGGTIAQFLANKGIETIDTPLGKLECYLFVPVTEVGRAFKNEDDMQVWISRDLNRIPVRIRFELRVGSFTCNLEQFRGLQNPISSYQMN